MITKKSAALLSTMLLAASLAGCSQSQQKTGQGQGQTPDKKDATAVASADGGKTATDATKPAADATKPAADASKTADTAATPSATAPADTTAATTATTAGKDAAPATADSGGTPQLPGQIHISLNELPDDLVICTVAGSPIKVADYRNMMKIQQVQLQQQIAADPAMAKTLLETAKQQNITLTPGEKSKLIATAKAGHGADFQQFLKDKNLTEAAFNQQVENLGLQFKVANASLEQTLLPQLVTREIMARAASGQRKQVESNFAKVKGSKEFEALKTSTGLSADSLHQELVKGELAKIQMEKIGKGIKVSESQIKQAFNANKSKLVHNERIRLSSILLIAPPEDVGQIKSVRTQLKAAHPKMADKDLDAEAVNFLMQKQNRALILLGEARAAHSNFAQLANENSEDVTTKTTKNGGDMGWQEKAQLAPAFAKAVWDLKPGTVLSQIVKTSEGFRVMKVTEHQPKGPFTLAETHDLLALKIKQSLLNAYVQNWVAQQARSAKVEYSKRFISLANEKSKTH